MGSNGGKNGDGHTFSPNTKEFAIACYCIYLMHEKISHAIEGKVLIVGITQCEITDYFKYATVLDFINKCLTNNLMRQNDSRLRVCVDYLFFTRKGIDAIIADLKLVLEGLQESAKETGIAWTDMETFISSHLAKAEKVRNYMDSQPNFFSIA